MRTIFLLILAATLASCGGATASQPDAASPNPTAPPDPSAHVLQVNQPRVTPSVSPQQTNALVRSANDFAADFYRSAVGDTDGNLCFSPYSISLAFSLLYAGARGDTATELQQALRFLPQDAHHPAFNAPDQQITHRDAGSQNDGAFGTPFQLIIANAIWSQQGFLIADTYLNLLAQQYGVGLRTVDFEEQQQSTATINSWVTDQTRDRIKNIVSADALNTTNTTCSNQCRLFQSNLGISIRSGADDRRSVYPPRPTFCYCSIHAPGRSARSVLRKR
jgi:serpin B